LTGRILYKSSVSHDLKQIAAKDKERLLDRIRRELVENPRAGEPLHGEFKGLFKMRVGDYRVIHALAGEDVLVLRVRHRGKAYG